MMAGVCAVIPHACPMCRKGTVVKNLFLCDPCLEAWYGPAEANIQKHLAAAKELPPKRKHGPGKLTVVRPSTESQLMLDALYPEAPCQY